MTLTQTLYEVRTIQLLWSGSTVTVPGYVVFSEHEAAAVASHLSAWDARFGSVSLSGSVIEYLARLEQLGAKLLVSRLTMAQEGLGGYTEAGLSNPRESVAKRMVNATYARVRRQSLSPRAATGIRSEHVLDLTHAAPNPRCSGVIALHGEFLGHIAGPIDLADALVVDGYEREQQGCESDRVVTNLGPGLFDEITLTSPNALNEAEAAFALRERAYDHLSQPDPVDRAAAALGLMPNPVGDCPVADTSQLAFQA